MEIARSGTTAARALIRSARAEGMPNVGADVSGRFQGPSVSLSRPGNLPGGVGSFPDGPLQPNRALEPQVTATVPLYTGGRVSAGKRAARRAEQAALLREQAEAQALVLDVTSAYLDTLEAREQADLAAALRALNQERLQIARVKQRAGATIPLEVSQTEADLATSVQREIEAEARVGQAGARLNSLIGRPVRAALVLEAIPAVASPVADGTRPLSPEELMALGMERPDLKALREEVRRAEAQVDLARAQRRPLVNFRANFLKRIPETLLGGFAWSLGASLVQTLFDGGRSRAQVEAARAELGRSRATTDESARQVQQQVEQARLALEAAEQRLTAEEQRLATAREALSVAEVRKRAGAVPQLEVTEARTTLTRAETDLLTARFEAARARVQLAYVTGTAYPERIVGSAPPR